MATLNGLPIYKMKPGMGVDFQSLVTDPAIEVLYKVFSNKERYTFNADKQIITGPFMIPDLPIYRSDLSHGEYYVVFDKQTVVDLNEMFMKEQKTLSFNYQHKDNSKIDGAVLIENWIVGEGDNKAKNLGFDVPVGTWMGSVKINNKEFWENEIKSGNVKGFSIEGYLDLEMKKITNKQKYMEAKTKDGSITIKTADESFVVGSAVMTVGADGVEAIAANGDYELENGIVLKVVDGKVTEIVEAVTEPEEAMTEEQIAVIQSAIAPILEKYEIRIKELETKLANTPAAPSVTEKKVEPKEVKPIAMTAFDKFTKIVNAAKELKNKQ